MLEVVVPTAEVKQLGRFDPRPEANKALWIESGSILFFFFLSLFFLCSFLINQGSKIKEKHFKSFKHLLQSYPSLSKNYILITKGDLEKYEL